MNVASLELCKKLYELSGWEGDEDIYMHQERSKWVKGKGSYITNLVPAYDLGYLLRKLPAVHNHDYLQLRKVNSDLWVAYYPEIGGHADTSEDATAKLAIELFKQGILKK